MSDFLRKSLEKRIRRVSGPAIFGADDFHRVTTDSRTIQKEDWFLALRGERFDGHDFLKEVFEIGVKGCFVEQCPDQPLAEMTVVEVDNCEAAFQDLARYHIRSHPNLKTIGITGSVGKTTAKNFLASICEQFGRTISTPKSFNNEIGVPKTAQLIDKDTDYAVFELAARHVGDIRLLTDIVEPQVRVLLNVGVSHLGEFGSVENILKTKTEIFGKARPSDVFVLPSNDERISNIISGLSQKRITFGPGKNADVRYQVGQDLQSTVLSYKGRSKAVRFPVAHESFQINGSAAVAAAIGAGIEFEQAVTGLSNLGGFAGRFEVWQTKDNTTMINDAYNSNPDSLREGIKALCSTFPDEPKHVVLGDMLELGDEEKKLHSQFGDAIRNIPNLKKVWTVGPLASHYGIDFGNVAFRHFQDIHELRSFYEGNPKELNALVTYFKASLGVGLFQFVNELQKSISR